MKNNFYEFVADELQKSLPEGWEMIPEEELPGDKLCKITHALRAIIEGKAREVNLFVWPLSLELNATLKEKLSKLRDAIVDKKALLIVISEEIAQWRLGDTGVFIAETLLIHCPDFLWITCSQDKKYKVTFDGSCFETLHAGLSNIWDATVTFQGPEVGFQPVNLEIMSDTCWRCHRQIKTVTGVVFPDQQLKDWKDLTWRYYFSQVPLDEIKGIDAKVIAAFVATLRQNDASITPVGYKGGNTKRSSYFAAFCPYCDAKLGSFHVMDDRMIYLHSLQSRMDGSLTYYTLSLDVDRYLIQTLFDSSEACDHTTDGGWGRY